MAKMEPPSRSPLDGKGETHSCIPLDLPPHSPWRTPSATRLGGHCFLDFASMRGEGAQAPWVFCTSKALGLCTTLQN